MDFIFGLLKAMPGSVAQGLIWGIMAVGVYVAPCAPGPPCACC